MKGELNLKIKEIKINGLVGDSQDLSIYTEDGFLHIVGDNNIQNLLIDAIYKFNKRFYGEVLDSNGEVLKRYRNPTHMYLDLPFKNPCYFKVRIGNAEMTTTQALDFLENVYNMGEICQL